MKFESMFDIIGHIIVGPSSSHTAGAAYIAYVARNIFSNPISYAQVLLHGSFAETHKGHGTDKAIIGGLLGLRPDDERLRESLKLAEELNLKYEIREIDLGSDYHPNSVKIILQSEEPKESMSIIGSSIGGGNIIIQEIDEMEAGFYADNPTIICFNKDVVGVIAKITKIIAEFGYNIANMRVTRALGKNKALCWIETATGPIKDEIAQELEKLNEIEKVKILNV